jgi:peroxiredoxin Q/BCP
MFDPKLLAIGAEAPGFDLEDESGNRVRLSDFAGRRGVVMVFYPMDGTPVCRAQLCEIRDRWESFSGQDIAVVGVNPGGAVSHRKFKSKQRFPFPLLVDQGKRVASLYGAGGLIVKRCVYGIAAGRIQFAEAGRPSLEKVLARISHRGVGGGPPFVA